MRTFLVCSGTFGRPEALDWLELLARERRPDGLLFAGGVLPWPRDYSPCGCCEFGHTREQNSFLIRFFATLGRLSVQSAVIPGACDAPLDLFLEAGMKAEQQFPQVHLVHLTPFIEGDNAIFGLGACINGYTNTNIGYYSATLAEYCFRPLATVREPHTVMLLPEPPQSWHSEGHDQRLAEALVARYRPELCVLGSPPTRRGVSRRTGSVILNPGYLAHGSAAWFDLGRQGADQVEFIDLPLADSSTRLPSSSPAGAAPASERSSRSSPWWGQKLMPQAN